jgi:hypothetical protein
MKETRSELKLVWTVVAVLSAMALGVDFKTVVEVFSDPAVVSGADEVMARASQLTAGHERMTLGTLLAGVAGIYTAARTVMKSINRWVEGKEAQVIMGGRNEGPSTEG